MEEAKTQQHVREAAREARQAERAGVELAAEIAMQEASAFAEASADRRTDDVRQAFTAAAARVTEPVAPNFDRDAANREWEDRIAAAGIQAEQATSGPSRMPAKETSLAEPAFIPQEAAGATVEPAHDTRGAERTTGRIFGGIAALAETVLGGILNFFGGGEPKLTPQQQHDRARAEGNEETLHARAYAAHEQAKEADQDWRIFEQNRQQQQEDFAASYGVPGGSSGRDRERDDYDRGRERER